MVDVVRPILKQYRDLIYTHTVGEANGLRGSQMPAVFYNPKSQTQDGSCFPHPVVLVDPLDLMPIRLRDNDEEDIAAKQQRVVEQGLSAGMDYYYAVAGVRVLARENQYVIVAPGLLNDQQYSALKGKFNGVTGHYSDSDVASDLDLQQMQKRLNDAFRMTVSPDGSPTDVRDLAIGYCATPSFFPRFSTTPEQRLAIVMTVAEEIRECREKGQDPADFYGQRAPEICFP